MKVKALKRFDHHGIKDLNDIFEVSDQIGKKLIDKGLVVDTKEVKESDKAEETKEDKKAENNQKNNKKGK